MDTQGIRVDTESLASILIGGIAFGIPQAELPAKQAEAEALYRLYQNFDEATERLYLVKAKSILYFDESVRGLDIGAPVEFWGIQMGQVLDVKLVYDQQINNFRVRVLVETETERFYEAGFVGSDTDRKKMLKGLLARGFRAQLKTGNLLTGKQVIILDFFPDAEPVTMQAENGTPIFPTVPAPMAEIGTKFSQILNKIDNLPMERSGNDLRDTIHGAKKIAESPDIIEAIRNLNAALAETRLLVSDLRTKVTPEINAVLEKARQSLANAEHMLNADAPLQVKMNTALDEISGAARSLRLLMDYLERHPESLIQGKGHSE
jgi:paraquat-inducible protein B